MFQAVAEYKLKLGLADYFSESYVSKTCHPRLVSSMTKLYKKVDNEDFNLEFIKLFGSVLMQNEKLNVNNTLEFIAKFCCHLGDCGESFLSNVIKLVIHVNDRTQTYLRLRICEFVSLLLSNMGPQAALTDEMFDMITDAMVERMKDKSPTIRSKAVMALQRLQDPQLDECSVIKVYLYHLEFDPMPDVRKKILENIAIAPKTLPAIISRSMDVSETVRKAMYKTIAKLKFSRFRISHRQTLLCNGLTDKNATVRDFVKKHLIKTWFEHCSQDFLTFLEHLDVQTFNTEILESLLNSQFSQQASSEMIEIISSLLTPDKLIPVDKLKPESAVLWLYVVKYFNNPPEHVVIEREMVEAILPTLASLALFIRIIGQGLTCSDTSLEFTLSCLIKLATFIEMDVAGASAMTETCHSLLLNPEVYSELLITSISELLEYLIPDSSERIALIAEITSDIQCPLEANDTDVNVCILDGNTLLKILILAGETLKAEDVVMNSTLFSFCDLIVRPWLSYPDKRVTAKSITVLSHSCMLDVTLAKQNFIKFQILIDLDEATIASALEAIFNQLLIHGLAPFFPEEAGDDNDEVENKYSLDLSNEPLLTLKMRKAFGRILVKLESKDVNVRSIAAQGLAKLMLSGQLRSPQVLARLIILWFSPDLGQDSLISQPLGLFFNVFAKKVASSGDIILGTVVPLIEHITKAPADSPSYLVDLSNICHFVTTLLRPNLLPLSVPSHQYLLAVTLTDYLLSQRSLSGPLQSVIKAFFHIELQKSDEEYFPQLNESLDKLARKFLKLEEKAAKNAVASLQNKMKSKIKDLPLLGRSKREKSVERTSSKSKMDIIEEDDKDNLKNTVREHSGRNIRSRSRTPDDTVRKSKQIIHDTIEEVDEDDIGNEEQTVKSTAWESSVINDKPDRIASQNSQVDMFGSP